MILDLSDVLSEHHSTIKTDVLVEMNSFSSALGTFQISEIEPVSICIEHVKERELLITGNCRLCIQIPCDRCLEAVSTELVLDFTKNVDLDVPDGRQTENLDETNYIDGYKLDVKQLLCNEILIGWPTKILCSEDCKGICSVCGQNLNQRACSCDDASLDPRMSVIRDVFKNFKEV